MRDASHGPPRPAGTAIDRISSDIMTVRVKACQESARVSPGCVNSLQLAIGKGLILDTCQYSHGIVSPDAVEHETQRQSLLERFAMKVFLAGTALALAATAAQAQTTALDIALAQTPVPCGGAIASAQLETDASGQTLLRVLCQPRSPFGNAGAGAPATNIGFLAPVVGIGIAGAALGLSGGGGGSSTSDTQ
ncbi:hypothetical protein [Marinovum sp.]|uniref:hypothetical protein n=1 Tax=Marinovum sp. TaxID=2024839 RepID=UPI002B268727|nr:hypothetical protein [Marinovum sp.]